VDFCVTTGRCGVGIGSGLIVLIVRPLWLMTTGLISTSPVMIIVPVRSLIWTRASVGSSGRAALHAAE
jgi:hypothetical protein